MVANITGQLSSGLVCGARNPSLAQFPPIHLHEERAATAGRGAPTSAVILFAALMRA